MKIFKPAVALVFFGVAFFFGPVDSRGQDHEKTGRGGQEATMTQGKDENRGGLERAVFAGGCFWCMEPPYDKLDGVASTTSGYIGGHKDNPTYEEVSAGITGHTEAVEIVYDPEKIGYEKLLEVFWRNIDPQAKDRQFCDSGTQYRSAIFYVDDGQKKQAEDSRKEMEKRLGRIHTEIAPASTFYPAEDYHQDYYRKNPLRYKFYRASCGRDRRLKELWGE